MKPLTIALTETDFQYWKKIQGMPGPLWKFWREIFQKYPMLKRLMIEGSNDMILHMRYVKGAEFRIEYSSRKLPPKAIKTAKDMETWR